MYTDYVDEENENNENYYLDDDNNGQNKEKIKKITFFVLIFVIVLIILLLIAKGCSNSKKNTNNKTSVVTRGQTPTVVIGRDSLSLAIGESYTLDAEVLLSSKTNPVIRWRSEDSNIASVNDDGYITGVSEGIVNIVAYYDENNRTYKNFCIVTVTSNVKKAESISLTQESISLKRGQTFLIQVGVTPNDAKVGTFTYESDDSSIASVDEKGYIKANSVGTTTITVKTEDNLTAKMNVIVSQDAVTSIMPTGLHLVDVTNGLAIGKTTEIIYNITPSNATNKSVTWKSSNPSVATVNNGIVTGVSAGTCTIVATTSNNISSSVEIRVEPNTIPVTGISIVGNTSFTMPLGGTRLLGYIISPNNATNKKVTYTSSNSNVIIVDSNGILAAVGQGNAVVTISTEDGSKKAIANVTVTGGISPTNTTTSTTSSSNNTSSNNIVTNDRSSNNVDNNSFNQTVETYSVTSSSNFFSSSSDTTSSSCNSYNMITISHNEKGVAIVSTISFANTKPFLKGTQTPTLEVTQLSCVKSLKYYVYYGETEKTIKSKAVSTGTIYKVGNKISLKNGKGYYRIEVKGTDTNGVSLSKIYYAVVEHGVVADPISVSPILVGTKFTITKNDSKLTRVYYCIVPKFTDNCTPSIRTSGLNSSKTIYYGYVGFSKTTATKSSLKKISSGSPSFSKGAKICFQGYNGNILVGNNVCRYIG